MLDPRNSRLAAGAPGEDEHDPHPSPPTDPGHRPDPPKKHPDKGGSEHPDSRRRPVKVSVRPS